MTEKKDTTEKKPILGNVTYDVINDIVVVGLPAFITLYVAFAGFWNWPNTEQIVGSIGAVGVFLGALLKVAQKRWHNLPPEYDGEFIANDPDPYKETFRLDLNDDLTSLANKDEVRLKVTDLLPVEGPDEPHTSGK